jgi:NAD(P)-dependent dehydrogenase (short-subunit alcohol dehydrogenase family)
MTTKRTVWITGGTKGIGLGLVRAFAKAGYQVFTCARRPGDSPLPDGVEFTLADLRKPDQVQAAAQVCLERFGAIDLLINNAGGSPMVAAAQASPRFSEAIISLNLLAPLHCATAVEPIMQAQDSGGNIINVASVSGLRPSPGTAAYGAAKAGLINLSQSLAIEWAPKIRVNAVALGMVETEQSQEHYGGAQGIKQVAKSIPAGRMASPADLASLCLYLDSPAASYLSGACIPLHGGGENPAFLAVVKGG